MAKVQTKSKESKEVKEAKDSFIRIRLSSREKRQVDSTAKKCDVSLSELVRQLLKDKYIEVEGQYSMFKKK